jgi:hypothetical protein
MRHVAGAKPLWQGPPSEQPYSARKVMTGYPRRFLYVGRHVQYKAIDLVEASYNRNVFRRGKRRAAVHAVVNCSPLAAYDGHKEYAIVGGFTVRGSSCPADRKHARRQAHHEAIEMSRGEVLGTVIADESRRALDGYVREGARPMLQRALECEVDAFLAEHGDRTNARGRKHVVRTGYLPARSIMTEAGPLEIQQP